MEAYTSNRREERGRQNIHLKKGRDSETICERQCTIVIQLKKRGAERDRQERNRRVETDKRDKDNQRIF